MAEEDRLSVSRAGAVLQLICSSEDLDGQVTTWTWRGMKAVAAFAPEIGRLSGDRSTGTDCCQYSPNLSRSICPPRDTVQGLYRNL
jgi:hypothetical protein